MKSHLLLLSFLVFFVALSQAQAPDLQWQKCYGGSLDDFTRSLVLTSDGGFTFCASAESNDGDVSGSHGDADFWLVKADASGAIQWQKCLGGPRDDYGWALKQTIDGGYIMTGFSISNKNDVSGNHGNYDYWVVKTDASGNIQWQKCFGGSLYDAPYAIQQTTDHGYVIAGSVLSQDGQVTGGHGDKDAWIIKIDSVGNLQWQKDLGGSAVDDAFDVKETADGGYIVAGNTASNNGDVTGGHGSDDFWVVKLNSTGSFQWQHCYGGSASEVARSVEQTSDGGYVVIGFTLSNDGDVTGNHGLNDIWVIKINSSGSLQWQKCFGSTADDFGRWVNQTNDGGYLIAGPTGAANGDISSNQDSLDFWIAKIDSSRNIQWQKSVGGSLEEYDFLFQADGAGNYFLGGYAASNDGDVSGNHGDEDVWIAKLAANCTLSLSAVSSNVTCTGNDGSINLTATGGFSPFVYHWSNGATTEDISGLTAGNYTVTVTDIAGCVASTSAYIAAATFATPINLSTTKITSTSANLKWNIVGTPSGFNIQYRLTSSSTWTHKKINTGTKTSYKLNGLIPSSQYEWQIREDCGSQHSAYSSSKLFTTQSLKSGQNLVANQLLVYPNPSSGIFTINVNGISSEETLIDVTDLSGKIMYQKVVFPTDGDMHETIDLSSLSNGYFILRVFSEEFKKSLPLVIER